MIVSLQQLYGGWPDSDRVAEEAVPAPPGIPEKLVRCLWFDSRWRPATLQTLDGQTIVVHSPGRWNLQAGPDFLQAVIECAGEWRRGDVEIHCYTSGWTAHRHHRDARYNQVILHVTMWHDRQSTEIRRADGQTIPQVALACQLPRPLSAYQHEVVIDDYPHHYAPLPGRCYEALRALPAVTVQQFLERAGETRLQQRMERWSRRAATVGLAQVMYEAVFRALGASGYGQPFQQLASLLPWQALQACLHKVSPEARSVAAEALLLGYAGLLPQSPTLEAHADQETRQYLGACQEYWARLPKRITQRAWHDVDWRYPHVRPANTPERRLAGMAQVVAHYHHTTLLEAMLRLCRASGEASSAGTGRRLCTALSRLFTLPVTSYWTQHARLGRRTSTSVRLIGQQRALTMVIDAVLPVLCLYARQEHNAWLLARLATAYQEAPRLPDNTLLRYMARRLLGNDATLLALVTGARQQQGLLQIFTDFCAHDEGDCQGCDFPLLPTPV